MAKKRTSRSATSQRMSAKYAAKNKPLSPETKKRLMIWLPIAAVVLIAAIVVLAMWPDGSLPVKDGVVVTEGDNWLIANKGTNSKPKYYKLAEVDPIEGFTSDESWTLSSDTNTTSFWVENDDTTSDFAHYAVNGITQPAEKIANSAFDVITSYATSGLSDSVKTTTIGGLECYYYSYFAANPETETEAAAEATAAPEGEEETAEDEEDEDPIGTYTLVVYFPALYDCSVMIMVGSNDRLESQPVDEATMLTWAEQAFPGVHIEVEEDK